MAEQKHYISQYRASNGTVFLLKDREVREALKSKANAASLGVATKRIDDLEDEKASKAELAEALSDIDIIDKTTRQLAVMYFLPPYQEGKVYQKDMIIRMDGRVFKSLTDGNTARPYTVLTDDDGTIIVNDHWQALILDDVNDGNWAQLDETLIPTSSIPDRMTSVETRMETFEGQATTIIGRIEGRCNAFIADTKDALNAQIEEYTDEMNENIEQTLQSYKDTLLQQQTLIAQQQAVIADLQSRLAYMDNITFLVAQNNNPEE